MELLGLSRDIWKPLCCVKNTSGIVKQLVLPGFVLFTGIILCLWLGTSSNGKYRVRLPAMNTLDLVEHEFCGVVAANATIEVSAVPNYLF
jgi:hypothetical protein